MRLFYSHWEIFTFQCADNIRNFAIYQTHSNFLNTIENYKKRPAHSYRPPIDLFFSSICLNQQGILSLTQVYFHYAVQTGTTTGCESADCVG